MAENENTSVQKDLGIVSAYGYAKAAGYIGTEEDFEEIFLEFTENAPDLLERLDDAVDAAEAAKTAAEDAKDAVDETIDDAVTAAVAAATEVADDAVEAAQAAQAAAEDAQEAAETAAATFETDTTLAVAGKAADSEAVGDKFAEQAEVIEPYFAMSANFSVDGGAVIYSDGSFASNQSGYKRTDYIDISNALKIVAHTSGYYTIATIAFYDEEKTYIKSISSNEPSLTTQTIDLTQTQYSSAKYAIITSKGFNTADASSLYAKIYPKDGIDDIIGRVGNLETSVENLNETTEPIAYLGGQSWSHLPISILEKFDFLGVTPQNSPYNSLDFTFANEIGAGKIWSLKHSTTGVRRFLVDGFTPSNTERYWNKEMSLASLCDYDYDGIFVLYDKHYDPWHVEMIGIAKNGATFTDAENDIIANTFKLSVFRESGYFKTSGVVKAERPIGKKTYTNLVQNPAFTSSSNWTLGTVWSISGGTAICNDTNQSMGSLTQSVTLTTGKRYRIGFALTGITSGSVEFRANWNEFISSPLNVGTYYEFEFTPTGTGSHQNEIMFRPVSGAAFKGKVSFVELVEI